MRLSVFNCFLLALFTVTFDIVWKMIFVMNPTSLKERSGFYVPLVNHLSDIVSNSSFCIPQSMVCLSCFRYNKDNLREELLMTLSIVLIASVFAGGLLSFFSPCIFPVLPVYLGILLDADDSRTMTIFGKKLYWYGIVKTLAFIFGLSTIFVILGYGAGFLGNILYAVWFRYLLGALVIILGIHQVGLITIKRLQFQKSLTFHNDKNRNGLLNAFILGLTFSFGWTPCVGPVLSSVLALVASGGNGAWQGGLLMIVYTLGLGIPFLLLSFASGFVLKHFNKLKPHMLLLKKVGGVLIIIMGILLMTGTLNNLAQLFG